MLAIFLFAVLAVAVLAPETPLGRAFRELLIEAPARKLNNFKRSHFVALIFAVGVLVVVYVFAKTDGVRLFALGFPEALSWFIAFDVATYIDAIALAALLASVVRLRAAFLVLYSAAILVRGWVLTRLQGRRFRQSGRASRRRRTPPTAGGSNAEDDSWRFPGVSFA
jgi:hypothetical protein